MQIVSCVIYLIFDSSDSFKGKHQHINMFFSKNVNIFEEISVNF